MPGLVTGIHVFGAISKKDVDGRDDPGPDDGSTLRIAARPPKMIREEQSQRPRENIVGLLVMIVGLILFLGVHTLTTQRDHRAALIKTLGGEGTYKALYGLVSLV